MSKNNSNLNLLVTIDRFEGNQAVLEIEGQTLIIPCRYLPSKISEGDVLTIEFLTKELATKKREDLARAILEEILKE